MIPSCLDFPLHLTSRSYVWILPSLDFAGAPLDIPLHLTSWMQDSTTADFDELPLTKIIQNEE